MGKDYDVGGDVLSVVLKVVGSAGVESGLGLSLPVRKQTVTFYSCSSMRSNSVAPKTNLPGLAAGCLFQ